MSLIHSSDENIEASELEILKMDYEKTFLLALNHRSTIVKHVKSSVMSEAVSAEHWICETFGHKFGQAQQYLVKELWFKKYGNSKYGSVCPTDKILPIGTLLDLLKELVNSNEHETRRVSSLFGLDGLEILELVRAINGVKSIQRSALSAEGRYAFYETEKERSNLIDKWKSCVKLMKKSVDSRIQNILDKLHRF